MTVWGASLGGITAGVVGAIDPALSSTTTVSGGGVLTDVTSRSMIGAVQGAVLVPSLGPVIAAVRPEDRPPQSARRQTSCPAGTMSLRFIVPDGTDVGELEFACRADLLPGDDVSVFNEATQQRRCARADSNGRLFLPYPSDRGDPIAVTIYRGAAFTNYERCDVRMGAVAKAELRTFTVFEGDCEISCGHVPPNATESSPARMSAVIRRDPRPQLASPAPGVGLRRQTAAMRRFIQLAQAGLDPGDPVNFAPLFSLRPWDGRRRPLLSMTTAGDDIVPVSAGITLGRAAGLVPFMTRTTSSELDDYVMPLDRAQNYMGASAEQVLVQRFVTEGIHRFNRHPVMGAMDRLFDADDLDEGEQGYGEIVLTPPLRMARVTTSDRRAEDDLQARWAPREGDAMSAYLTAYIVTDGTHVFLPSNPGDRFDIGLYLTNLVARFASTRGRDIAYVTNPRGHHCLEDNSCSFIPAAP
jgi:hypothetical protein